MDGGYSPMMSTRYVPWRMRGCKLKKPGLWQRPQKRTPRPDRSTLPTMVLNGQIGGLPGLSLPRINYCRRHANPDARLKTQIKT